MKPMELISIYEQDRRAERERRIIVAIGVIVILLFLAVMAAAAQAQTIVGVTIANGQIQWTWVQGKVPLVDDGLPTEFRAKCGLKSGNYTVTRAVPFVFSPTNIYKTPLAGLLPSNGTWFCIVTAFNPVAEAASSETSFFGGTAPTAATGVGPVA